MGNRRFTQDDLDALKSKGARHPGTLRLNAAEGRALLSGQALPVAASPEPPKGSKLRNEPTMYNGDRYDSKAEARHAARLDLRVRCGELAKVERQVLYELELNGILLTTYVLDFRLTFPDGRQEFHDVKGQRTGVPYRLFKLKATLMLALHGIDVQEISA
jgi:hypothetical protein